MILLITYNKMDHSISIDNLHQSIQKSSESWWHHLNDTWIIRTNLTVNQVFNNIAPNITAKDRLMIVEIKKNYQGWLSNDAWTWLNKEFDKDMNFVQKLLS